MARKELSGSGGNKQQVAAFCKAARSLGCEPNENRFQEALRRVAKAKPGERRPKPAKAKRP